MIREVAVSAPGKTILMGEHAAVYGHPAIVAAIDLRLTATVRPAPGQAVRLEMPAIGWRGEVSWTRVLALAAEKRAAWRDALERGESGAFVPVRDAHELALIALGEAGALAEGASLPGLAITIESDIPPGAGCGSSAALGVAILGATARALGLPCDEATIAGSALAVERQQHGRPSGVDVEAALRGGIVWFRRCLDGTVEREELPFGEEPLAAFRLFHSGAPRETTGDMVGLVRGLASRDPGAVEGALAAIDAATRETRYAMERADGPALVSLVRRCEAALETLSVVPSHVASAIRGIERAGGAAKISGAGGRTGAGAGLVLVVHPDDAWHARFEVPGGWRRIPAALGAPGLREEAAA